MVEIAPARLNYLKNAKFNFKFPGSAGVGDDYAGSCSAIRCDPQGAASTFFGMKPTAVYSENGGWQLVFTFADDYDAANSLWSKLFEFRGQQATIEFWPHAGGVGFSVTATVRPGGIGGETRQAATSTVTLECSEPVKLPDPTPGVIENS